MRVLAIAAAAGGADAAIVKDGFLIDAERYAANMGLPAALPLMVARLLARAGQPDLVAAVVGPGSFTGLRASLSLAQGVALGANLPLVGVTVAEAIAEALPSLGGRHLWVAMECRRDHVFLDRSGDLASFALADMPLPVTSVAIAGDAANLVAATLAARNADVMLTSARRALPRHAAVVAARRHAGLLPALAAVPLYVDPPAARRQAARPAPQ